MMMRTGRGLKSPLRCLVSACFLVLTMFPFVWMPLTFLKRPQGEIYAFLVRCLPNPASAVNYVTTLWKGNFGRYMLNPFFSSAAATICAVFIAILASCVISRFHSRFKNALLLSFLVTQMIPMFIMLIPLYQLPAKAKMLSDLRSLAMLYMNMMIPFSVVTLCDLFDDMSKSLEEAAWIDGCGHFKTLSKVVVPAITLSIAATFIFVLINSQNELFIAIVLINVDKFKTIPVGLGGLILRYDVKWGKMTTGTIMSLVPTICLFVLVQKYTVEGLTAGSVKS